MTELSTTGDRRARRTLSALLVGAALTVAPLLATSATASTAHGLHAAAKPDCGFCWAPGQPPASR